MPTYVNGQYSNGQAFSGYVYQNPVGGGCFDAGGRRVF